MKAGWEIRRLGEFAEVITKGTTPTSVGHSFTETGINFIKVESITERGDFLPHKFAFISDDAHQDLRRSQLQAGDVLFSIAGALGRTAIVTLDVVPANTNQALSLIRLKSDAPLDRAFLVYCLGSASILEQIEKLRGGAAQQNLSLAQVREFPIPLPPLEEQKRIVAVLDEAFEGLTRARAHAEANLQNARELFESFRDELLGNPHSGWINAPLSKYLERITYGFTNPMPDASKGPLKITAKNVINGAIDYEGARSTTQTAFDTLLTDKSRPSIGDVLLTKDGTLGRTAVVDVEGLCVNQSVAVLTPTREILSTFLHEVLSCRVNQTAMIAGAGGATIKHLYITRVPTITVFVPDMEEQERTLETLAGFQVEARQLISHYTAKLQSIDALRQSLLQKAFAGELT